MRSKKNSSCGREVKKRPVHEHIVMARPIFYFYCSKMSVRKRDGGCAFYPFIRIWLQTQQTTYTELEA